MISILIIDNEEKLLINLKQHFKKKLFKIKNLTEISFLEQELETYFPDILIININVLNQQQEKLVQNLNKINKVKYIPKIFLTINSLTEDRITGYNLGCYAYVSKPFDPEELEAIINNLVKQTKMRVTWLLETYIKIKKIKINFLKTVIKEYVSNIPITIQEKKIISKITEKKTNIEIASELKITKRTVERIVSRLLNKTNMNTRADLVKLR